MALSTNWPQPSELTEAHHEEPSTEQSFPEWLLAKAERIALYECGGFIENLRSTTRLIAEHLADEAASRRYESGGCLVWGCPTLAAGPLDLYCHTHAAQAARVTDDTHQPGKELPPPYGMDTLSSDDPHRIAMVWEEQKPREITIRYIDDLNEEGERIVRHYVLTEDTPDETIIHDWASDHIGRFTR